MYAGQADEVFPLDPVTLLEMPVADPESRSPTFEVVRVDLPGANRTRLGEIPARQFMIAVGGSFLITANGEGVVLFRIS